LTAAADGYQSPGRTAAHLLRRHADFRRLWSATTVSQFGTQVSELAIPLTAILVLHARAFEVGVLNRRAARTAPAAGRGSCRAQAAGHAIRGGRERPGILRVNRSSCFSV
jgi:hypothetical protein